MKIEPASAASCAPYCGFLMPLGKSRLRLRHPLPQCTSHVVVRDARPDLAWLDMAASNRYTCLIACLVAQCPCGVQVSKDSVVKKPVDNLTLRAEDGEALIARVHLSNLPRADAETVGVGHPEVFSCGMSPCKRPASAQSGCGPCSVASTPRDRPGRKHHALRAKRRAIRHASVPCSTPIQRLRRRRINRCLGRCRSQRGPGAKADTARGQVAWAPQPIQVRRVSSAATQSGRRVSVARCVVKAPYMICPPGWRDALTAMPCSAPDAMRSKSCGARRVARYFRQNCLRVSGTRSPAPRPGRRWP